ncbi:MAG: DUF4340 domain-containing protein [Gammaproteobacteria bacterium]|nr:DUF4340 domain-containing protein [Gammaproteobacteria bacterium]MDH5734572.1 DUF4340 domain-containing protein [Gammaproteobacteria bacterium]
MNTRGYLNIFLLILVILLVSFIIWNNNETSYLKLKITNLEKDEINIITIPREKGDIILKSTTSGWLMHSPYKIRGHEFRINQLLNLTQLIAENSYETGDLNLSQFNLDPSDTSIIFNKTTLEFGTTNPVNLMRYIKSGNKLFLVKDTIYPLLRSQPTSFISLSLLPENSTIKSIAIPAFTVIRDAAKKWKTTPEQNTNADTIQKFIQNWKNSQAFGIHAYMERKNLGHIRVELDNGLIEFEITDNDPWLILARKDIGIEYHLDKSQISNLLELTTQTKKTDPDN